ncbi:MAG: hypothetical protein ABJC62_09905 [Frankiaceae bacterium]
MIRRAAWLTLVGYLVLAFGWTARLWVDPAYRQPPNPPDVALLTWFLTWDAHPSLSLHANQLNVPDGVNVMWQTGLLLPGVLLAPLTRAAGAQVTYSLLLTLGLALSAWSAYLALRLLRVSGPGPLLGGLLYGFGPAMVAQAYGGHLQFTLAFLPPVMLVLSVQALRGERRTARTGVVVGLLAGAQLLIGAELLLISVLAGLVVVAVLRPPWRRVGRLLAGAIPAGGLVAAWPVAVLLFGRGSASGNVQATGHYQEDLAGLFLPTRLMLVHPFAGFTDRFPTGVQERTSYLGGLLVALGVLVVLRRWADQRVRVAAVVLGVFTVASLGADLRVAGFHTGLPLPWALVERAPVLGNVLPSRFPLLVALAVGVLLGVAVERPGRSGVAVAILALVPLIPAPLPAVRVPPTPAYFTIRPTGTLLVLPFPTPTQTDAMRWQAAAGLSFRMPGGFFVGPGRGGKARFGAVATSTTLLLARAGQGVLTPIGPAERAAFRRDAARWRANAVVLGPSPASAVLRSTVTGLLGRPPDQRAGVEVWPIRSGR